MSISCSRLYIALFRCTPTSKGLFDHSPLILIPLPTLHFIFDTCHLFLTYSSIGGTMFYGGRRSFFPSFTPGCFIFMTTILPYMECHCFLGICGMQIVVVVVYSSGRLESCYRYYAEDICGPVNFEDGRGKSPCISVRSTRATVYTGIIEKIAQRKIRGRGNNSLAWQLQLITTYNCSPGEVERE
jgi:hypothetical protein